MTRCQGLLGRMFGHKFLKNTWHSEHWSDYCYRCGMPKGGWKP